MEGERKASRWTGRLIVTGLGAAIVSGPAALYVTRTTPPQRPNAAERFVADSLARCGLRLGWVAEIQSRESAFHRGQRLREIIGGQWFRDQLRRRSP